jgi:hypothetical protein
MLGRTGVSDPTKGTMAAAASALSKTFAAKITIDSGNVRRPFGSPHIAEVKVTKRAL